jgi:HAMP domain-containing protein
MKTFLKDLNWKFGFVASVLIVAIVLAAQTLLMKQARIGMETRLGEKAAFVNSFYSFLIADALQRKDDVTLLQVVNRLEEDPEVTSVVVVDEDSEIRYHADPDKLGTPLDDPLVKKALETGDGGMNPFRNTGGRALALVSPLKVQGKPRPIGAIRIDLTYRHVDDLIRKFDSSFHLAMLAFICMGIAVMIVFLRRWVTYPLEMTEKAIGALHLATAEPNFPERPDEFGRLNKAVNDMIMRYRTEFQDQIGAGPAGPAEVETDLVERILRSFFPQTLIFIADKDNKIISGTKESLPSGAPADHVLDLITDVNFANLVGAAFQKEGEPVQGPVLFHGRPYKAAVLCIPAHESKLVKTLIVMQADVQPEKGES